MARPRKAEQEKRNRKLVLYLTEAEETRIEELAAQVGKKKNEIGLEALSQYVAYKQGGMAMKYPEPSGHEMLTGDLGGADIIRDAGFPPRIFTVPLYKPQEGAIDLISATVQIVSQYASHMVISFKTTVEITAIVGLYKDGLFLALPDVGVSTTLYNPYYYHLNLEAIKALDSLDELTQLTIVYGLQELHHAGYFQGI